MIDIDYHKWNDKKHRCKEDLGRYHNWPLWRRKMAQLLVLENIGKKGIIKLYGEWLLPDRWANRR